MNLVLLPGNSKANKEWIDSIDRSFSDLFSTTLVHYYDHWWQEDGEELFDIDLELDKLASQLESLDSYMIFAKSAGVLLSLYGIYESVLDPQVCMYVGTPIHWAKQQNFVLESWLNNYSVPSLFVQKEFDPAGKASELESLLQEYTVSNYQVVQMPGEDHKYTDTVALRKLLEDFVDL